MRRSTDTTFPYEPYSVRFQASRPLSDDELDRFAQLAGYAYRSTVNGEPMGGPVQDSPYSFVVDADTTKGRGHVSNMESALPDLLRDGSPVRTTDRAGACTRGTRLIDGFGEDITFETYYDSVTN